LFRLADYFGDGFNEGSRQIILGAGAKSVAGFRCLFLFGFFLDDFGWRGTFMDFFWGRGLLTQPCLF